VSLLRNHLVLMVLYALATALFFTLLWKSERKEQVRFFLFVFVALVIGAIALAWVMYPFPLHR
jgi:cytochrome bd-type quinol oxidase subunit 2